MPHLPEEPCLPSSLRSLKAETFPLAKSGEKLIAVEMLSQPAGFWGVFLGFLHFEVLSFAAESQPALSKSFKPSRSGREAASRCKDVSGESP